MGKKRLKTANIQNSIFFDNLYMNNQTFQDYINRFTNICLSMFEWVNLPETMNARSLELSLFQYRKC